MPEEMRAVLGIDAAWTLTQPSGVESGGAEMTVTRIEQIGELTVVYCVWIDQDHKVQRAPFPDDALEAAKYQG
jgi:uncharacterized protein YodC (DUF2158 family)